MTIFLLKLTICWGFFALLYTLLLRQETFFRLNRGYLLGTAALGIALAWASEYLLPVMTDNTGTAVVVLPAFTVGLQQAEEAARHWKTVDYLWIAYGTGVILTTARMLWGLARLVGMAARGHQQQLPDGCVLIRTMETEAPFSFFRWVFVPESQDANPNSDLMLAHERAHAQGWHSADVVGIELLCIVFWFHPLAYWYRRALRTIHEYLADAEAARQVNKKQYGLLLIWQAQSGPALALVHHFFQSPLKQRLIMLMKQHSAPVRMLK